MPIFISSSTLKNVTTTSSLVAWLSSKDLKVNFLCFLAYAITSVILVSKDTGSFFMVPKLLLTLSILFSFCFITRSNTSFNLCRFKPPKSSSKFTGSLYSSTSAGILGSLKSIFPASKYLPASSFAIILYFLYSKSLATSSALGSMISFVSSSSSSGKSILAFISRSVVAITINSLIKSRSSVSSSFI